MAMLLSIFLFSGCFEKDEPEPDNCAYLDHELEETQKLAEEFGRNPTRSTCNKLKSDQLSLLKKMQNCPAYDKTEVQNLLNFWNDYDCTIF